MQRKEPTMQRRSLSMALALFCGFATIVAAESFTPKKNTHEDVKEYVKRAAKLVEKKGPDCAALKSSEWMSGDYYIFVSNADDKILCHPNAKMVGKYVSDIVDANGKNVGKALTQAAANKGGGWTNYVWPRPGDTKPVPKSSYSM